VIGQTGVVQRDLDPDGVVQVASEEWSARSTGGRIPKGRPVRVVDVDGLRLVVEPVKRHAPATPGPEGGSA
jgi:membrane-bound serine protease (ClpP class)